MNPLRELERQAGQLAALELAACQLQSPELARMALLRAISQSMGLDCPSVAVMAGADWPSVASNFGWDYHERKDQ